MSALVLPVAHVRNLQDAPPELLFHLHVHVVPRFTDDHFAMPYPAVAEVPRADRERQASAMRQVLAGPPPGHPGWPGGSTPHP